jgi:hypothetical protein
MATLRSAAPRRGGPGDVSRRNATDRAAMIERRAPDRKIETKLGPARSRATVPSTCVSRRFVRVVAQTEAMRSTLEQRPMRSERALE